MVQAASQKPALYMVTFVHATDPIVREAVSMRLLRHCRYECKEVFVTVVRCYSSSAHAQTQMSTFNRVYSRTLITGPVGTEPVVPPGGSKLTAKAAPSISLDRSMSPDKVYEFTVPVP